MYSVTFRKEIYELVKLIHQNGEVVAYFMDWNGRRMPRSCVLYGA